MHFKPQVRRLLKVWPLALGAALLGGCTSVSGPVGNAIARVITPYRVEVVQGNVVTSEQAAMVKPGLTRDQVRQVLGAPLLADPFHAQRWDYVFLIRRQGTEPQQRSVVVTFDGDLVKTIEAPELPSEKDFVASISRSKASGVERKLELTPEERAALPPPSRTESSLAAAAAVPAGPARAYPPLEAP